MVDEILSGRNCETVVENIHNRLTAVQEDIIEGKVDQQLFYITKVSYICKLKMDIDKTLIENYLKIQYEHLLQNEICGNNTVL